MSEAPMPPPLPLEPLRVEPLAYHNAMYGPVRPGILIAVGVISIFVGAISVVAAAWSLFTSFTYSMARTAMATAMVMSTTAPAPATPANGIPDMMSPPARAVVTASLIQRAQFSGPELMLLDRLLAKAGDQVFPFDESQMTPEKVAANISAAGQTTAADGSSAVYFIVANGRIEISDNLATFSPTRGQMTSVSREELAPPAPIAVNAPVTNSYYSASTTAPAGSAVPNKPFVIYGIASGLNLLLALYLIVIGIMVLAKSRKGRYLHLVYAVLKIPAAIFACAAYFAMMSTLFKSLLGGAMMGLGSIDVAETVLACIYPVALLTVMNLPSVKQHYKLAG